MRMMKRLFDNLGKSWEKTPKYTPVIEVEQGTGTHFMYTIEDNQLHFHSMPYNEDLPIKQSIVLEEISLQELVNTINNMGYVANLTSEADNYTARKSFTLMPVKNRSIVVVAEISTFTSKMWETLYPIARLLHDTENDMDKAIAEMFATSTKGKWLDYWASFFNIKRSYGEGDNVLARRIFMTLVNLKTTNLAIEELVSFAIKDKAKVEDIEPSLFQVTVSPVYSGKTETLSEIINAVRGAGIDFIYHFLKNLDEHYPAYLTDKTGVQAKETDVMSLDLGFIEMTYGWQESDSDFDLNQDTLNTNNTGLVYTLDDSIFNLSHEYHTIEHYDKMQEEILPYLVYFNFSEVLLSISEDSHESVTVGNNEPGFRFKENSFELNSSLTNSSSEVGDHRVYGNGSMELLNSDGTVAKTATW